jgi:hypothetical protein
MFQGRTLVIVTKHSKEKVIAPIFKKKLEIESFIVSDFDTDSLGTFTGEKERADDAITTARKKCLTALHLSGCDMAIASEGSFGQHPSLFFIPADEEILLFIDLKNNLEIIIREVSTKTNFNAKEINNREELDSFAIQARFPDHGLILMRSKEDVTFIEKGIRSWEKLRQKFEEFKLYSDTVYIQTDMRAMHNPMRMKVIELACEKLVEKIKSKCPHCFTPGFATTEEFPGLPCELCQLPTNSSISSLSVCCKCKFGLEKKFPHGKKFEDAQFCNFCNP